MKSSGILAIVLASAFSAFGSLPTDLEVFPAKFKDGKKAAVSFTFDDGDLDHNLLVAPNLKNVVGAERSGSSGTLFDNQVTIVVADKWGGKEVTAIRGTKVIPSIVKDNNLLIDMFPNDKISLIFK